MAIYFSIYSGFWSLAKILASVQKIRIIVLRHKFKMPFFVESHDLLYVFHLKNIEFFFRVKVRTLFYIEVFFSFGNIFVRRPFFLDFGEEKVFCSGCKETAVHFVLNRAFLVKIDAASCVSFIIATHSFTSRPLLLIILCCR